MARRPRNPFPLLLTLVLASCDGGGDVVGRWSAAAIDGVGVASATPRRIPVPPATYDTLVLTEGWMWKEYSLDSLTLDLAEDGTFVERTAESSSSRVMRSSYVPAEYVHPAFGGELIRDAVPPKAHEVRGAWTRSGDTIRLVLSDDDARADVTSNLEDVLPGFRPTIDSALDRLGAGERPPRWEGTQRGERLELRDPDGTLFVFRRASP